MDFFASIPGYLTSLPLDYVIPGVLLVLISIDALRSGDGRSIALGLAALAAPTLLALSSEAAFVPDLGSLGQNVQAGITLGVFLALFFLFRRMFFYADSSGRPLRQILASFAAVALILTLWTTSPALSSLWEFGGMIAYLFNDSYALFIAGASLIAFAVARS